MMGSVGSPGTHFLRDSPPAAGYCGFRVVPPQQRAPHCVLRLVPTVPPRRRLIRLKQLKESMIRISKSILNPPNRSLRSPFDVLGACPSCSSFSIGSMSKSPKSAKSPRSATENNTICDNFAMRLAVLHGSELFKKCSTTALSPTSPCGGADCDGPGCCC